MSDPATPLLWVVDPSMRTGEDQGLREILLDWPGRWRVFRPALIPCDGPSSVSGYDLDGVVVMGSAASVYDRQAWIARLSAWLDPILRGEPRRPVLGICFGHQLIAHLAGGRVGFVHPDRRKLIGVEETALAGGRLLDGKRSLRVVVSHREEVKDPPPGYRVVARRGPIAVDGLEHATLPIFSFQFHPEARDEFAARVGIAATAIDEQVRADSQLVLGAFRRLVANRDTG